MIGEKKKKRKIRYVRLGVCVCIAAVAIWSVMVAVDVFGIGPGRGADVMVTIPKGATTPRISEILKEEGVIKHPLLFRLTVKIASQDYIFQQGGHLIGKNLSYSSIAAELTDVPDVDVDEKIQILIPEGYEAWQIADTLEKAGLVDKNTFLDELDNGDFDFDFISQIERRENRLEGYLFPATYEFYSWEDERDIIIKMLKAFETYVLPVYRKAQTGYTLDQIITMASVVEREAANDSERGRIASVFYNRMERDMTLSSCATVQYIIRERKPILSNSDIKIKSPYNTYINKGLPIGPIASPGVNSVKAALYPDKTDYLYFAAKADGSENVFSRTDREHMETVKRLQGN
jgi:UPF0755 protein